MNKKEVALLDVKSVSVKINTEKKKLTRGEMALLALMKKKIEDSDIIVLEEVIALYVDYVRTRKGEGGEWIGSTRDQRAKVWFRSALGNLILKAKLIAIPVIDID